MSAPASDLEQADVCVLVVTYNSAGHLPQFLQSLHRATTGLRVRVVAVDNGSQDGSVEAARNNGADVVIKSDRNLGYAGGINLGRPWSTGCELLLVANPDVVFSSACISILASIARAEGAVSVPAVLGDNGEIRRSLRREPTVLRQLGEALLGDRWPSRPAFLSVVIRDASVYEAGCSTDWATGAALMIPRECDDAVGPWNEDYFLYSEEVDFARRARIAGFPVVYAPEASAIHSEGGSGGSPKLTALDAVNRIRYFASWHTRKGTMLYASCVALEHLVRFRRPSNRAALRPVLRAMNAVRVGAPLPTSTSILGLQPGIRHADRDRDVMVRVGPLGAPPTHEQRN